MQIISPRSLCVSRMLQVAACALVFVACGLGVPTVALAQAKGTSVQATGGAESANRELSSKEAAAAEKQWKLFFQEARSAYGIGEFHKARSLYLKAGAIKMTPKILGNLAQVEIKLGEFKAAANHAAAALLELGHDKGVEEDLAIAKKQVVTLVLIADVDGATVAVNGEVVGTTPLPSAVYVDEGERRVTFSKPGFATVERNFILEKGSERHVEVRLSPEASTASAIPNDTKALDNGAAIGASNTAPVAPFEEPKREPAKANPVVLIAGGAIALGGLVAGLIFNAKANSKYDDAEAKEKELRSAADSGTGSAACSGWKRSSPDCKALHRAWNDGDNARDWSTASFVMGGAVLVGTAVYWLWPPKEPTAPGSGGLELEAAVLPGNAWIGVSSQF